MMGFGKSIRQNAAKSGHSANQLDYPKADIPDWSCDDVICVCGATMPGS
jgi:hypothetical protein